MAIASCPHCGRRLPDVHDAFCSFCREPLDELLQPVELDERPGRLAHIPRAPDVRSGGWNIPKLGLLLGIGFGILSVFSKEDQVRMNESARFVGSLIGASLVGGLFGYLIGLLVEKLT